MEAATILHADLDAFYASVEQLLEPSLRGRPIAVGGGVVLAASYEAKAFGVHSAMPGWKARELCPELIFVSGHFKDYQRLGDAAIKVVGDSRPSSNGFPSTRRLRTSRERSICSGPPAEIAKTIRRRVRNELGLPISVGVARTKHLAKIASQVAKPDGLLFVDPSSELDFLHNLPVEPDVGCGAGDQSAPGRHRRAHHRSVGQDFAGRAGQAARSRRFGKARRARLEPGSAGHQNASARAFCGSAVGAGRSPQPNPYSGRPFGISLTESKPPAREVPVRPHRYGAGAL